MGYETILYSEDGPVGTLTLNRPDDGNMFTETMCHEVRDCINAMRRETRTRVLVITGAGDRFFCIGGRKTGMPETRFTPASCRPSTCTKHRAAAKAGHRLGQRLCGRRRQRLAGHVRHHDRQGKRHLPPGRADDGQLRRRVRHLVPRRPRRQEEGQGDLVPQPADQRPARRWKSA